MKLVLKILKGLLLFMTSIWGIFFGMIVPLAIIILGDDIGLDQGFSSSFAVWLWFLNSFIFHLGGTLVTMVGKMRVAFCMGFLGLIISFIDFHLIEGYYIGEGETRATMVYMPQIFISVLIIVIAFLTIYPQYLKKKELESVKKAPSILDKPVIVESTNNGNAKTKMKRSVKNKMRKER